MFSKVQFIHTCPHHIVPIYDEKEQKNCSGRFVKFDRYVIRHLIQFLNSRDVSNFIRVNNYWKSQLVLYPEVKETLKFNQTFSNVLSQAYQKSPVQYNVNMPKTFSVKELKQLSQIVTNKLSENPDTLRTNKCKSFFKIISNFNSLIFSTTSAIFSAMVVHKKYSIISLTSEAEVFCETFLNVTQHCFSRFKKANLSDIYEHSIFNKTTTEPYIDKLNEINDELNLENDRWRNSIILIIWSSSKLLYSLAQSWKFKNNRTIHENFKNYTDLQKISFVSSAITTGATSIFLLDAENYVEEYVKTACALHLIATGIDYLYYKKPYQIMSLKNKLCAKINGIFQTFKSFHLL